MNIPERITSNGTRSKMADRFNVLHKMMVESYARLPFHLGEAIPHNPKEIDAARLQAYCDRMMSGLSNEGKNVWRKLYNDALIHIKVIGKFFEAFPDAEFDINDSVSRPHDQWLSCTNKNDVIDKAAEVDVPEDCKAYFDKVQSFANALAEMREYEKTHGIEERSIEEMTYYAAHTAEFAGKYIDGSFWKK